MLNKMMMVALVALAASAAPGPSGHLKRLLRDNLFFKINGEIQKTTNKVFTLLKLARNFTQASSVRKLLTMYNNLKSLTEYNYETYEEVKRASKVHWGVDNNTINALFNMTEVMDELFDRNYSLLYNNRTLYDSSDEAPRYVYLFTRRKASTVRDNDELKKEIIEKVKNYRKFYMPHFNRSLDLETWVPPKLSESLEMLLNSKQTRRIFKGVKAKITKYPFVASIHIKGDFVCAGSVISNNLVLTSASCMMLATDGHFANKSMANVTVRVSSDYVFRSGVVAPVDYIHFHPNYSADYLWNNLAIVKITRPLTLKQSSFIKRVEIEKSSKVLRVRAGITILGWGDKDRYSRYRGPLSMGRLQLYPWKTCEEIYSEHYVAKSNFCAGFVTTGSGACSRDIGGPALLGSKLVGVVSFGPPVCGTPNIPTVFMKVSDYQEWIGSVMQMEHTIQTRKWAENQNNDFVSIAPAAPKSQNLQGNEKVKDVRVLKSLFNKLVMTGAVDVDYLIDTENAADYVTSPVARTVNNETNRVTPEVHLEVQNTMTETSSEVETSEQKRDNDSNEST